MINSLMTCKVNLVTELKKIIGSSEIEYLANIGNVGDSLLATISRRMFRENGINYHDISAADEAADDSILVIGGGGNLIEGYYRFIFRVLEENSRRVRKCIILPQSVRGYSNLLSSLGSNVYLFVREMVSYDHARTHIREAHLFLADDISVLYAGNQAFNFNVNPFLFYRLFKPGRFKFTDICSSTFMMDMLILILRETRIRLRFNKNTAPRILYAFRTSDSIESTGRIVLSPDNEDLSIIYKKSFRPDSAILAFWGCFLFLRYIDLFDDVYTDRLHVAISSCLLGKKVFMFDNSYSKNKSIWEFTMRDLFPQLEFIEIPDGVSQFNFREYLPAE